VGGGWCVVLVRGAGGGGGAVRAARWCVGRLGGCCLRGWWVSVGRPRSLWRAGLLGSVVMQLI